MRTSTSDEARRECGYVRGMREWIEQARSAMRIGDDSERERLFEYVRESGTVATYMTAVRAVWPELVAECLKSHSLNQDWLARHGLNRYVVVAPSSALYEEVSAQVTSPAFARMLRIIIEDGRAVTRLDGLLRCLVEYDQLSAARLLLDTMQRQPGWTGRVHLEPITLTPIIERGDVGGVQAFLDEARLDFDPDPETIRDAVRSGSIEMLNLVLAHPISQDRGSAILYAIDAVGRRDMAMLSRLLAEPISPGAEERVDDALYRAFNCAIQHDALDMATAILPVMRNPEHHAAPSHRDGPNERTHNDVFREVVGHHPLDTLRYLFDSYLLSDEERSAATSRYIHVAARAGRLSQVAYMLEYVFRCDGNDYLLENLHNRAPLGMEANSRSVGAVILVALLHGQNSVAAMMLSCKAFSDMYAAVAAALPDDERELEDAISFTRCQLPASGSR